MSSPLKPDSTEDNGANAQGEVVELVPSIDAVIRSPSESFHVELVAGRGPSLSTETTSLLHARLRAVTILLLVVYGIVLVWAVANQGADLLDTFDLYRNLTVVRLMILGAILAVLHARETYTQPFLRGVEYTLFGVLMLF